MHAPIAKMLCLHIPALHPPTFTELELEVPAVVQTAALLGVGMLYQGSAHRLMTEVLLGEIGRPPTNELLECRESYALSAGLALGMLTLILHALGDVISPCTKKYPLTHPPWSAP